MTNQKDSRTAEHDVSNSRPIFTNTTAIVDVDGTQCKKDNPNETTNTTAVVHDGTFSTSRKRKFVSSPRQTSQIIIMILRIGFVIILLLLLLFPIYVDVFYRDQPSVNSKLRVHFSDTGKSYPRILPKNPNMNSSDSIQIIATKTNSTVPSLDFSIIGFPKTGTSALLRYVSRYTRVDLHETCGFIHETPSNENLQERHLVPIFDRNDTFDMHSNSSSSVLSPPYSNRPHPLYASQMQGRKCPKDISIPQILFQYEQSFSHTKLIVGLRHPIFWFESLYNFKVLQLFNQTKNRTHFLYDFMMHPTDPARQKQQIIPLKPTHQLTGRCFAQSYGVCAWRASFADFLAQLGKTPMSTWEEFQWLEWDWEGRASSTNTSTSTSTSTNQGTKNRNTTTNRTKLQTPHVFHVGQKTPHVFHVGPVFLYDYSQLSSQDSIPLPMSDYNNSSRMNSTTFEKNTIALQFRKDLAHFLGYDRNESIVLDPDDGISSINTFERNVQYIVAFYEQKYRSQLNQTMIQDTIHRSFVIHICDSEHDLIRSVLLKKAQRASTWIRQYLLASPDVIVSSKEYFIQRLEEWMYDPCPKKE